MQKENKNLEIPKTRKIIGRALAIIGVILMISSVILFFAGGNWGGSDFYGLAIMLCGGIAFIGLILTFLGILIGKLGGKGPFIPPIISILLLLFVLIIILLLYWLRY